VALALAIAIFAVYARGFGYGFLSFGDLFQITQNPVLAQGFGAEGIRSSFSSMHGGMWTPITSLSLLVDQAVFGLSPAMMHAESTAIHAGTAVLLFFTLRMATGRFWCSAIVAALFGLHPVSVEGVAWLAERRTVLGGLCAVLAVNAYLRYTRDNHAGWYWTAVGCQVLALLSNPITAALPLVLLAVDRWPAERERVSFGKLVAEKIPFAVVSIPVCLVSIMAAPEQTRWVTLGSLSPIARLNNAIVSYLAYLVNLFWPTNLAALYPHPQYVRPTVAVGVGLLLLAITLIAYAARRSRPYLFAGWLWFLAALIPALGLINVAVAGRADRFAYFAQIGIFAAATWLVADLLSPRRRKLGAAIAVATLVAAAGASAMHVRHWVNSLTLLEHAIDHTGPNAAARELAGWERLAGGDVEKAAEHFEIAVRIQPELTDIWNQFGEAVMKTGRTKNAVQAFWIAVRQEPRNLEYRVALARSLIAMGELDGALEQYTELVRQQPDSAEFHNELGKLFVEIGRDADALEHFERAARIQPGETSAWHPQADLQAAKQRLKAEGAAEQAVKRTE
jgi:tetratricopeptide (TPR) repeat protein